MDRADHCFLFDSHYALAKSHWQQMVTDGNARLVVMEALKCPLPSLNNGEDNAVFKSLIGTLIKCPGPGHCADPLFCKAGFFQVTVSQSSKQTEETELPDWIDHANFNRQSKCHIGMIWLLENCLIRLGCLNDLLFLVFCRDWMRQA